MKKIKIALVYDAIYPYIIGGGQRRYYEFGKRLAIKGYEVHLYGMKYWKGPKTIKRDGLILHGLCKARPLYTKSGRRSINEALIFGMSCFKLLFADFDIIDCCGFPYFSLFPTKLAALIKRKPLFSTWHEVWGKKYWIDYLGFAGIIGFWVEMLAAKLPDHIIATSRHTANQLESYLGIKCGSILENGVDLKAIGHIKDTIKLTDILYVGRIMDFKNIHLIIESLVELKKKNINLSCVFVGDGPEKEKLQKLASELGVPNQINWLGTLENSDEVYLQMKASKMLILPSRREGFGIVAIEANANGTQVLTANYASNAVKDLIQNGVNGYVFQPNIDDLSATMLTAIKQRKKIKQSTIESVKPYDWDNLSHKLLGIYAV
jgi:glycosyltransferase involved in cell wall biosynthesis